MYPKASLRVPCYFAHAEIAYVYACTESVHIVVFMNAPNLHVILNIFLSSLFTIFTIPIISADLEIT